MEVSFQPVTCAEYFTACAIQLCAGVMWAYGIGGLVGVAAGMQALAETYRTRIDQANALIDKFEDPEEPSNEENGDPPAIPVKKTTVTHSTLRSQAAHSLQGNTCVSTLADYYHVFNILTPDLQEASSLLLLQQYLEIV